MKLTNLDVLDLELPETGILETIVIDDKYFQPKMGRGACSKCNCSAYGSDSTNSGYCICGHTAANHAFD